MSEYQLVEHPVLKWLCGESGASYGARGIAGGLGWTYRDETAMAAYDRPLDDPLVEKILIEKIRLINPHVYEAVKPLILNALDKPRKPDELVKTLKVRKTQLQDWVKLLLKEGVVEERMIRQSKKLAVRKTDEELKLS